MCGTMSMGNCVGCITGVVGRMVRSCSSMCIIRFVVEGPAVPVGRVLRVVLSGVVVVSLNQSRSYVRRRMEFGLNVASVCVAVCGLRVCERKRRRLRCACEKQCL